MSKNKKTSLKSIVLSSTISASMLFSGVAQASDHIDFTGSNANTRVPRELDLTDLFAWTSAPGRLVLGLNTNLAAQPITRFSNSHLYRFRLRRVSVENKPELSVLTPAVHSTAAEVTIVCSVNDKVVECSSGSMKATTELDKEDSEDSVATKGARLFAGLRSDPFILDLLWAGKYTKLSATPTASLPEDSKPERSSKPNNFSNFLNVLNLTLEVDTAKLFGDYKGLIAVAADVVEASNTSMIIDRVGRPELTNMTIRKDEVKEQYNIADTYNIPVDKQALFGAYVAAGVSGWDQLDKVVDWSSGDLEAFRNVLVNDFLVVDLNESCVTKNNENQLVFVDSSYLDVETNRRKDKSDDGFRSCGGRTPTEDIIDTMVSYYTSGPKASNKIYGDGADKVRNPPTTTWPYFSKPFIP